MPPLRPLLAIAFATALTCSSPAQTPPSSEALNDGAVARFFSAAEPAERERAVAEVAQVVGHRRDRLSEILHGAGLHGRERPGRLELEVPVGHGRVRRVVVQVPRGYAPDRPWPLLLAYHGSGGSGDATLSSALRLLGRRADGFLVVAPHRYRQTSLDHPRPVSSEHSEVLRALRERLHVDSDRVYVMGNSLGGYTAWHLGTLHAELFAGALPMASTFSVPSDLPGLIESFLPNLRHLPVLSVWGGRDRLNVPGLNARRSAGDMSTINRRLRGILERHEAETVIHHEVPRAGHGGFQPPPGPLEKLLRAERVHHPASVLHRFRYVHQAQAYWVEGHEWSGPLWDRPWPAVERRRGESEEAATARTILGLLGEIRGEIRGQELEVESRHLADLTVWIGEGMVDWGRPVTVSHNGREVFAGRLEPDLGVALAQAARTWDLDRIRWAGVRIDAEAGSARVVQAGDAFPPVLREVLPE